MSEATVSVRTYVFVFGSLLLLLFITVGLAFIPVRPEHEHLRDLLTLIGFSIASAKAVLIVLWFMHVKISTPLTWIFASAAFVWLVILFVLTLSDYWTREHIPGYPTQHLESQATGER